MKSRYIILILLTISKFSAGQGDIINTHYHQFDVEENKETYKQHSSYSNEANAVSSVLFLFYKEFISSQDIDACVFTPSCSVYAMESIKTKGIVRGLLSAFDRLCRCNPMAQKYYPINPETQRLYDPVQE